MKKIVTAIINFFKLLFQTLISPFLKNKEENNKKENNTIKSEKLEQLKQKQIKNTGADTGTMPDSNPLLSNPHDNNDNNEDGETESTRIYSLPRELQRVLNPNEKYSYLAFSDEEIDALIDDRLEDIYKERGFKVYKANNVVKKNIEKLKKEIIPTLKDKIYYNNITNEKLLKKEIEEILKEQLLLTPIFEEKKTQKKKQTKKGEDPYFLAMPKKKELDLPKEVVKVDKEGVVINLDNKEKIEEKLEMPSLRMVQNTEEIPKPPISKDLPKLAVAAALTVADTIVDTITVDSDLPKLKEENKEKEGEQKENPKETEESIELPKEVEEEPKEDKVEVVVEEEKEEIEKDIETIIIEAEEVIDKIEEENKEVEEEIEEKEGIEEKIEEEAKEEQKEEESIKEEIKRDYFIDMKINRLNNKAYDAMEDAKKESEKSDFFDKDYDAEEQKIDDLLDKIENARLKYGKKLTPEQEKRLKKQEDKLRDTKDKLKKSKDRDIAFEKSELESTIKEVEINGLQREIKKMDLEYKAETNDNLLKKMDKLEGMTKEQVASIDRKILMSRYNKASFLLEMSSLLAFPFIRNKYFRLFTIGLVVDNHLGFAHAFLNRKANRYQPVDLEGIKKGQDALDNAIDLAYKDLVQLDYIEEQALSKHPELADDPAYQASITRVRNNLVNQFNKLQHKQDVMEKYSKKGVKQKKTLKKIEAAA